MITRYNFRKCANKNFLHWLGGLIDGEGCFCISKNRFSIRIVLEERDGFVLDYIEENIGGYRRHRGKQKSWKSYWKEQEEWGIQRNDDSYEMAKYILPFLILKKQTCIDFIKSFEEYGKDKYAE